MATPKVQQIEQTTTNLPAYAQPYVEDIMGRAQSLADRPYTAYPGGDRIAGMNAVQSAVGRASPA